MLCSLLIGMKGHEIYIHLHQTWSINGVIIFRRWAVVEDSGKFWWAFCLAWVEFFSQNRFSFLALLSLCLASFQALRNRYCCRFLLDILSFQPFFAYNKLFNPFQASDLSFNPFIQSCGWRRIWDRILNIYVVLKIFIRLLWLQKDLNVPRNFSGTSLTNYLSTQFFFFHFKKHKYN